MRHLLVIINDGDSKGYDLTLRQVTADSADTFVYEQIALGAGDTHYIQPADWGNLAAVVVTVEIDWGSDGTIDETVELANQWEGAPDFGYWKTHSSHGPAPYDESWALIGEDSPFFLSDQSYYEVLWTQPRGNPYYILAHPYIAAELNLLAGYDLGAAQAAFDEAATLFETYTPEEIAAMPGGSEVRKLFVALADKLGE